MKYNLLYCSFVVLMCIILIILPQTLAPWKVYNPPDIPPPNHDLLTCAQWLVYNRFDVENVDFNKQMARYYRDPKLDRKAFYWSVGYAYLMSGSNPPNYTPLDFCNSRGISHDLPLKHLPLKSTVKTCKGWIFLYGYDIEQYQNNLLKARSRKIDDDMEISHWVAGYGELLSSLRDDNNIIHPDSYCFGLGINSDEPLSFFTRSTPFLSCEKWLYIHGYTDNPETNFTKAQHGLYLIYPNQKHYLVKHYAIDLLIVGPNSGLTPRRFCARKFMGPRTPIGFSSTGTATSNIFY